MTDETEFMLGLKAAHDACVAIWDERASEAERVSLSSEPDAGYRAAQLASEADGAAACYSKIQALYIFAPTPEARP